MRKIKQSLALLNALCLLGSSAIANPITIDTDHTGPSPTLGKTDNGVDLINIAKPNQAGISSNFYKDFNVEKEGLILNNISQKEDLAKTVLAGYIAANPNLETAAKLILNQVSGNKLSNLLGFLEVAGKQADVILANPNGITCHGCGFINIENLTLATGKFSQDEFHRLNQLKAYEELKTLSLDITQGKIITSALNASNTKTLTFLAKNMEVNGIVEGGDKIRALLGSNHVNFSPSVLLYEPIKLEGEQQALGLDVTYLGGVFAKSIYLVATNEGIGVKNSGILASTASQNSGDGGFVIDANGTIEITKPQTALIKQIQATKDPQNEGENAPAPSALPLIFSNQNLDISAKNLVNHSILYAKDNLNIKAENILNQGALEFIQNPATREKFYSRDPNINGYFGGSKTYYMTYDYTIKTIKESIQKDTYSPAMMLANNIHLQSQTTTNDNALIQANNDFQNASKEFINKAPQAKSTTSYEGTKTLYNRYGKCFAGVKIGFNCASTRTTSAFVRADKVEFTDVELPEITLQDTSILLQDTLQNTKSSTPLPTPYVQNKDVLDLLVARRMQDAPSTRRDIMDFSIFQGSYQKNLLLGLQAHSIVISSQNTYNSSAITGNDITITSQALLNENGTLLARDTLKLKGEAITNQGGKILAQNISIDADGFTHTSSITSHKKDRIVRKSYFGTLMKKRSQNLSSTSENTNLASLGILEGNHIIIKSKETHLIGANVDAKGDLLIQSDTLNVKTLALKDDYADAVNTRNHTNQQVTSIQSGNHLLIDANKQEYTSVKMKGENIALQGENILFDTSTKESFSKDKDVKAEGKPLNNKTTITTTATSTTQHIANEIQGTNLAIHSKSDFTAYNLQTDSQNLAIQSDKNILISNHADTKNVVVDTEIKKRSLYGSISKDKFSAGLRTSNTKIHQDTNDKNHHNTTLKASHAAFVAQGNTAIQSTNIQSDDLGFQGENIALKALQDEHTSLETKHVTSHTFGMNINRRPLERIVIKYANSLGSKLGIKGSIKVPEKEDIKAEFSYQYSDDFTKTQSYATSTSNLAIQSKNLQMDSKNDTVITNADITTDVFAAKNKNLAINTLENVKTTTTTKYNDTINASLKLSLGKQTGIKAHADYAHDGSKEKNTETSHVANHFKIGTLNLDTKNDVKIQGSHLDIKEDANITAKNFAITSVSNTETNEKTDKKHNAALDFTYNGGFNVALSGGYGDSSSKENKVTLVASSLSAKNLNLKTSEKTQILGSRLNIEEDANITAKSFIITSTENSFAKTTHSKDANASLSAGFDGSLDLGANGGYTQKVTTQSNNSALSSDVSIKNLNLQSEDTKILGSNLTTKKAQITSKNLWIGSIQTYSKDTESSLGAQAGLGNKSGVKTAWDYNNKAQNSTGQTASHVSLGDFQIEVRGDTQIKGSHLSGDNGSIQTQNLNVLSSEETQKSHNIGLGAGNTNLKFRGNASLDLHTQITQSASSIEAQNLKLAVKNDMNVESSQIKSENLDAEIGRNLNMVSKKDTEASFGVSGSLDMATKKKDFGIKGSIASQVKQQSSIEASNANIKVGNQTKLVGAKIEAKKGSFDGEKVSKESLIDYKVSLDKKSGKKLQKDFGHGITKSQISIN